MTAGERYDTLGVGYALQRRPDVRLAAQINEALGDARRILNLGAGTGNYEPSDRFVVGLEPSSEMLGQRTARHPAVQGVAETLPFPDQSFDSVMAIFTIHHWRDQAAGLREAARVAPRQVLQVYDLSDLQAGERFWLGDYFPGTLTAPWEATAPTAAKLGEILDVETVEPLRIPPDCTDGFMGAYWCRPEFYLRDDVHRSISSLAILDPAERADGIARLRSDLESGVWDDRHGHLRDQEWFDFGYRLATCRSR